MTLPKGFGGGGGGASRSDVEGMIGKRIENYTSLITLSYLGAFFATMFGTMVGYLYYPWAYASSSAHYAMIHLQSLKQLVTSFVLKSLRKEQPRKAMVKLQLL